MAKKKDKKPERIDEVKAEMLEKLSELDPSTEEATAIVKNLKLLEETKATGKGSKIDKNEVLKVVGTLGTAGLVLLFEHLPPANIIRSKAASFIPKIRL